MEASKISRTRTAVAMITDNQLDSLATGLGLTMMALIIVSLSLLLSVGYLSDE